MNEIKVVLFDLDGTLIDTLEDLGDAVNHALERRGFPLHTREEYRRMVGHGIRNLVRKALPDGVRDQIPVVEECLADFRSWYSAHIDVHTRPYPGIPALLSDLDAAGICLAVASNKFQEGTEHLIHEFFPDIRFAAILGNREGFPLKPDPQIVEEALRASAMPRDAAIMVGDSPTDMLTAANGGIRSLAVTWGYRTPEELSGAEQVRTVEELRNRLLPALVGR